MIFILKHKDKENKQNVKSNLNKKKHFKFFFIPESFHSNITHQLFDYILTFVNSQRENTNSKGDFVLKCYFLLKMRFCTQNRFGKLVLKISGIQK